MRELHEDDPPRTPEEILRYGIVEIATTAPGSHADPTNNPCYGVKRKYKDFAVRILEAAEAARAAEDFSASEGAPDA